MNIIFCVGISGAGKSTWVNEFLKSNQHYLRINRDDLRRSIVSNMEGYYKSPFIGDREKLVTNLSDEIVRYAGYKGLNLLIDNTNLKMGYLQSFFDILKNITEDGYSWQFKLFDCNPTIAKQRVIKRDFDPYFEEIHYDHYVEMVKYIDIQYEDYLKIKKQLLLKYKENILL